MKRGHAEDAPAGSVFLFGIFEVAGLDDYREVFGKEYQTQQGYEQLLVDEDGKHGDDAAEGERAGVAP